MRKNEVRYRVLKAGSFSRGLYFYFKKKCTRELLIRVYKHNVCNDLTTNVQQSLFDDVSQKDIAIKGQLHNILQINEYL